MALPNITVIGNLAKIETKIMPNGKKLLSFQVNCSEKNTKGEWENLWLKGEVWEKSADFVEQYFKDGSVAIVTGQLITNVYKKQDGSSVYENKLKFPSITFAPKDKLDNNYQQPKKQVQQRPKVDVMEEPYDDYLSSEVPF